MLLTSSSANSINAMKILNILLASLTTLAVSANAQIIFSESFDYVDGNLTTVSSSLWVAHSGAGSVPVQVSNGTISVQSGGSREDVNALIGGTYATETLYAGFDLTVGTGAISANGDYFFHFKDTGSNFRGRVFVTPATVSGFKLGLDNDGGTASQTWTTDLNFGEEYRVVLAYDASTRLSTLWVDPENMASTNITDTVAASAMTVNSVAFRQGSNTNATQVIDNLVVALDFNTAAIPEPSTYAAILGLVVLGLAIIRRRK